MDKFKYVIDSFWNFAKYVWINRKGNKSIVVIRCWFSIAIALIGLYCFALYADSNGNWLITISTPTLGLYELLFFIVNSIASAYFLYIINYSDFKLCMSENVQIIRDNTENILDKTDATLNNTSEILAIVKGLENKKSEDLFKGLSSILDNVISTLIESLKLKTSYMILCEIENLFSNKIQQNTSLRAKIAFYKGESLLFSSPQKAIALIHEAYILQPKEDEYKKWEVKYCLVNKDYKNARNIASSIKNGVRSISLVNIVSSDNESLEFIRLPEDLRLDPNFRYQVLECLINKGTEDVQFLMEDTDEINPTKLSFSTINEWLLAISLQRRKINNYMILSFDAPQVELFKEASRITTSFYELLSKTEIFENFEIIRCLHCYWKFISSKDNSWIAEYQKVDRKDFDSQKIVFSLMESSMLVLAKRFEEAFAIIVSACKVLDESIITFVIMMSVHSGNHLHLIWILNQMKTERIKVSNRIAVLIANTLNKDSSVNIETTLAEMDFEIEEVKELILQLCKFHADKRVDVNTFKDKVEKMPDEFKAYAANLLADAGDTQLAFEMLSPIVDEEEFDMKLSVFLSVLDKMQEKTPLLYRILVKKRKAGNRCNNQLLWKEYQLDTAIADYENALEVIMELYQRHPNNPDIFANYMMTLGHLYPEKLSDFEQLAKEFNYPTLQSIGCAYHAFAQNNYLETATEILYKAAKNTDDYDIRNFYNSESLSGPIRSVVHKEYDVAAEGNYVLCDMDGKRNFYKASNTGGNIGKAMLGVHKGDVVDVIISFKPVKLTIIGIHDKYYKLAGDILREAQDGNNPGLQPFEIDMERPWESLQDVIRKISKDESSPEERQKKVYEQYERGELGLLQLVPDENILSGYYKLLFTSFTIHVNIAQIELQQLKDFSEDSCFILDLPTIITFAEFEAKTGLSIKGPKTITKVLHEYIREANKTSRRVVDADFYESMKCGMLTSYSDYHDVDAIKHIEKLLEWTDTYCKDIIAEKALVLFHSGNNTKLKNELFSSLSMLLQEDTCFVTDDKKIKELLPYPNIISTESYVYMFNDEETSTAYSQFLFECGFRGVDLQVQYMLDEYNKMENHEDNRMVAIIQNMQENPFLISKAVACCIQLVKKDEDLSTLRTTFTSMFTAALKGFVPEFREHVVKAILQSLSLPLYPLQFTCQCLIDSTTLAK